MTITEITMCDIVKKSFNYLDGKINKTITPVNLKLISNSDANSLKVIDTGMTSYVILRPNVVGYLYEEESAVIHKITPKVKLDTFCNIACCLKMIEMQYNNPINGGIVVAEMLKFSLSHIKDIEKVIQCNISKELILHMVGKLFECISYLDSCPEISEIDFIHDTLIDMIGDGMTEQELRDTSTNPSMAKTLDAINNVLHDTPDNDRISFSLSVRDVPPITIAHKDESTNKMVYIPIGEFMNWVRTNYYAPGRTYKKYASTFYNEDNTFVLTLDPPDEG